MNDIGILGNVRLATIERFKSPLRHTMFLAELGVRQPFAALREVKQIPEKGMAEEWEEEQHLKEGRYRE